MTSLIQRLLGKWTLISSDVTDPQNICWSPELSLKKITFASRLQVQQDQIALMVLNQRISAILESGCFPLDCIFDPLAGVHLSSLKIYFFTRKAFLDQRWGTATPLMINRTTGADISLRAHGTFSYQVDNPKTLWRHIPMGAKQFTVDDMIGQLRSIILNAISEYLANAHHDILHLLQNRERITQEMLKRLSAEFSDYGLKLTSFLIQSFSFPKHETL